MDSNWPDFFEQAYQAVRSRDRIIVAQQQTNEALVNQLDDVVLLYNVLAKESQWLQAKVRELEGLKNEATDHRAEFRTVTPVVGGIGAHVTRCGLPSVIYGEAPKSVDGVDSGAAREDHQGPSEV